MRSVFWLVPDSIGGRPGPQLSPWELAELRSAGFDAIINLSEHPSDLAAIHAAGMEGSWVPLPTDVPPTSESEAKCIAALPRAFAFLAAQVSAGRRVLVHCYAGKDRTGMLLALYLARRDGLDAAAAIRKVREARPLAITAPGWERLALAVIPRVLPALR
jgi:protein-tyrosine phosphatase